MGRDIFWRRLATGVTLACMALVAVTSALLFVPSLRTTFGFSAETTPVYVVGEQVDVDPQLYAGSTATVLIFARSTCSACQRAQPDFAALVARLRSMAPVRINLLTTGATAGESSYARSIGLNDEELKTVDPRVRVRVVPTILVVDGAGTVKHFLEGIPTVPQQDDLVRVVTELASAR